MPISEVFNQDCIVGLTSYPDKFFDLAIVDPPYGINATQMQMGSHPTRKGSSTGNLKHAGPSESVAARLKKGRLNSGGGHMKNSALTNMNCEWDLVPPSPEYFAEIERVSKNRIIWGSNYFPLPPTRCMVVWDKRQPWDNFSQVELAWTSFDRPAALFSMSNTGGRNHETKIHPTQKPVRLYSWLLSKFAQPGNKIIDTHMGSQSSRIAAFNAGFDYWGWEIDKQYFDDGNKRFAEKTAQIQLFK